MEEQFVEIISEESLIIDIDVALEQTDTTEGDDFSDTGIVLVGKRYSSVRYPLAYSTLIGLSLSSNTIPSIKATATDRQYKKWGEMSTPASASKGREYSRKAVLVPDTG